MNPEELFQGGANFMNLPPRLSARESAAAWVLPVPYDGTTYYAGGTRNGPDAIIAASRAIEPYDREFGCSPVDRFGIHTLPAVRIPKSGAQAVVERIEAAVNSIMAGKPGPKTLATLGGEHTISAGVVRGLAKATGTKDLVCVQIDAHADLRDEYEGAKFSHACAARRISEVCPVYQIGIRNVGADEEAFRNSSTRVKTVFADEAMAEPPKFLDDLAAFARGKRVYITIDVDGLDPSIMPSTGTPEPGGLTWERTLAVARTVCRSAASVPGFDVVELAPVPGLHAPDFLAALLVYKMMALAILGAAGKTGSR
jgi:agmatinase